MYDNTLIVLQFYKFKIAMLRYTIIIWRVSSDFTKYFHIIEKLKYLNLFLSE